MIIWLSKDFHAITFEKYNRFNETIINVLKNKNLQKKYTPRRFFDNFNKILYEYKK